jgi:hypothetical protein
LLLPAEREHALFGPFSKESVNGGEKMARPARCTLSRANDAAACMA